MPRRYQRYQTERTTQIPDLTSLDQQAFGAIVEPHRRELQVHCYRMTGSVQEAEDLVQETFLRAWRRRETFEGRASFRAWLYKIATNLCMDHLDKRPRRLLPTTLQGAGSLDEPIPAALTELIWLEPFPDDLLAADDANPESRYTAHESITVAFMAALHLLPPRQRAVLIMRDVLDWHANETAELLGLSVPAVKSALHRARTTLSTHYAVDHTQAAQDQVSRTQLAAYVRAWEQADIQALISMLKEDAAFSMPPIPAWYQGRENIRKLVSKTIFAGEAYSRWHMLPARASGQPTFGLYRRDGSHSVYRAYGIQVLRFAGQEVAEILTFNNPTLFPYFNLPSMC